MAIYLARSKTFWDSLTLIYRNQSLSFSSFSLFLPSKQARYQIIKYLADFYQVWCSLKIDYWTNPRLGNFREISNLDFLFFREFSYSFLAKLSTTVNKYYFSQQILFKSVENSAERRGKRNIFCDKTLTLSDFFVLVAAMTLTSGLSLSSQ